MGNAVNDSSLPADLWRWSASDLARAPMGFNPQSVMTVRTRLPYPNDVKIDRYGSPVQQAAFVGELLRRARALPGVAEAAALAAAAQDTPELGCRRWGSPQSHDGQDVARETRTQ